MPLEFCILQFKNHCYCYVTCSHVPSAAKCLFYKKWKDTLRLPTSISVLLQITRFKQFIKKHRKLPPTSINCARENRPYMPQALCYVHISKHVLYMLLEIIYNLKWVQKNHKLLQ